MFKLYNKELLFCRVKVLTQLKEYQLNDIKRCEEEKENLRKGAEQLAEKYEDVQANQQEIQKRYMYDTIICCQLIIHLFVV